MKKIFFLVIMLSALSLTACSEYQKLLKSTDYELKYDKALEYYNKKKYIQSQTLLDEIKRYFQGTERSQEVLYFLAQSFLGQKDYYSAGDYFSLYIKTFPKGHYAAEAKFLIAKCFYLNSSESRLDQSVTYQAISALQEYIETFPEDENVPQAATMLDQMNDKLAYKQYLDARLYYNLGNYMGNNYLAAVIVAQNTLKDFPATTHKEALLFLILQAKYAQAINSFEEKQTERYQDTVDEYYSYINEFPEGKNRTVADKIFKESNKFVQK